ncbi:amino acid adenylation domain-containing protein [Lysobacter sp. F6437]|uniref:amino acid adenylation domain-containing protein n=1 Tax=Lysobacter sp. F6437 TaxID=3459296 RepID=UPI00403E0C9A
MNHEDHATAAARAIAECADVPGLASRFEEQAANRPDAIAVCCGDSRLTYAELDRRANQLAHHLLRLGVGREDLVGFCMDRSVEMIVAMLAIVKAGAAYLPLDLIYPKERLAYILEDAGAQVVLTLSGNLDAVPETAAHKVCLDGDRELIAAESETAPGIDHGPDTLAYVMYTSGSTGKPKGCMVTQGNVVRYFTAIEPLYDFRADDVWAFFLSPAFDVSGFEIWGALTHGARLVVVPHLVSRTPEAFRQLLVDEQVTVTCPTPTGFLELMRADEALPVPGEYALRYVILGGEAVSMQSLRPWFQRHGDAQPQVVNMYGPTEATIYVTFRHITRADVEGDAGSMIGTGIPDVPLHVLDKDLQPLPTGEVGELFIGGRAVIRGYHGRPDLTAERFIEWRDPRETDAPVARIYRTGDLVRMDADGDIEYLGRIDHQVKIRGFRIELGEIEATLGHHPAVRACAVLAREDRPGEKRLVAYVVPNGKTPTVGTLRAHLEATLPDYMMPAAFVMMDVLPQNENGKLDRRALPAPDNSRPALSSSHEPPVGAVEQELCGFFAELLDVEGIGRHDNFFELGGNSVLATRLLERIRQSRVAAGGNAGDGVDVPITLLFRNPTPTALARALDGNHDDAAMRARMPRALAPAQAGNEPIAIVAMSGRFPGAGDVEAFWQNLCDGRDTITLFQPDELDPMIGLAERSDPSYVAARGVIDGVEQFDAAFFGIGPREAEVMDPQQRIFLELCWDCLERAGHVPDATGVPVGVFAGMYNCTYFQNHVMRRPDLIEKVGAYPVSFLNDKDYIATRVAHKLNLTGPAINVQTACSTSLVAICQAVDSLRAGQCDMALAGGASVTSPPRSGYLYQEGAMFSVDGHTRTFDARAQGTVFSDGAMVVLLKRLSDALADGDQVHAVIRGAAINNDGGAKASFTAPNSDGQAAVIAMAHRNAGVEPRSIGYVEAHGTATPLGDPIEIEGMTKAFRLGTDDAGFCRIGSVKSNVGHLVIAAGGAGLIKAALALEDQRIPASLHYESPNPAIEFDGSPFVVNSSLTEWPRGDVPRRAGVSSFGVGGTNAHVVLEEAPQRAESLPATGPQLLVLSARTPGALGSAAERLAAHLQEQPGANLGDVAWTLAAGRKAFAHRIAVVAEDVDAAVATLRGPETAAAAARSRPARSSDVVFMFPGQGAQYAGMGRGLYESELAFRTAFDECADILHGELGFDLRERVFGDDPEALRPTSVMQPATFAIEYSLARLWMSLGVQPAAMIGHSVGEFVAATLAGVFALPDALRLVARRGALMQAQPEGGMLSIRVALDALLPRLPADLSLAAENSPGACVVAGPHDAIARFQAELDADGIACRALCTSHAFHSAMMDPVLEPFHAEVAAITRSAPQVPLVSTATGDWLDAETAMSAEYWSRHLREPVRFATGLGRLLDAPSRVLLEVGPRATLSTLSRQHPGTQKPHLSAVASLADNPAAEPASVRRAAGQLWCRGVPLDPAVFDRRGQRRRVRLPTYPFERQRYWIEAPPADATVVLHPAIASTPDLESVMPHLVPQSAATAAVPSMPAPVADRKPRLVGELTDVFEDVVGFDLSGADADANFMELGLDSLMLTQVALQLQRSFSVKVTFRQLMSEYSSLDRLAAMLDEALPPDVVAAPPPAAAPAAIAPAPMTAAPMAAATLPMAPAAQVAMPVAANGDFARQLIAQQMNLMSQQLALLGGQPMATPVVAPELPAAPATVPVPAATSVSPAVVQPGPAAAPADAEAPDEEAAALAHTRYDVNKAFGAIARIHTSKLDLDERQHRHLETFIQRYVARTAKSRAYTETHRPHMADPRVVNGFRPALKEICYQIVIERSKGSHMFDIDGNEYVDANNGFGMSMFGWQPDFVLDAVREQLDLGYEIGPQHPLAGEVSKLVCEFTGHERTALCNTGSEAVLGAMRIARTITGRSTIVSFSGSYHGINDEVIVRGTRKLRAVPAAPGILPNTSEQMLVLDYGTPESLQIIRERAHELAAVLVEPVQSRRPDFQPVEFLREIRKITEEAGAVLIFDEVITGFRSHPAGTQALFGIKADLATYGKVIGGGYPLGVISGKRAYMDALDGGQWQYGDDSEPTVGVTYFAGTFVRHPLALAAAKAVLEHMRDAGPQLQERLNTRATEFAAELNAFCEEVGAPIVIRQFASMWRTHFLEDHPMQDLLFAMMRSRGIHILDNFPCFFTTAHSEADVQAILEAYKASVLELQGAGLLPGREASPEALPAVVMDPGRPPVPGARLGREPDGRPAWFVANEESPGKFRKVSA